MKNFKTAFLATWACFALNFAAAQTTDVKTSRIVLDNNINVNSITLKRDTLKKLDALTPLSVDNMVNIRLDFPNMGDLLFDAGVIKDKKNFTALINNKELVVNGKKQPEQLHQDILKKYQREPNDVVNLSVNYSTQKGIVNDATIRK